MTLAPAPPEPAPLRPPRETQGSSPALLWWLTGFLLLWQIGAHVDAWYHTHYGFQIESFVTWPHALLYGSWAGTGLVLVLALAGRARRGLPRNQWIPPGYGVALLGVALFGLGGVVDFIWHALFGFEVRLEILLSPAHLWLLATAGLVEIGVLRAAVVYRGRPAGGGFRPTL